MSARASFDRGEWLGAERGVAWEKLRTRSCWVKRAHKQRRVPVWFNSVPDALANTSCSKSADLRWSREWVSQYRDTICRSGRHGYENTEKIAFLVKAARLHVRSTGSNFSLLLVGDSVDRKMWEAFNNSRAADALHQAGVCVSWTPQLHSPELALSWLSDPLMVETYGAPFAVRELRNSWDRGDFFSFAKLDKGHDELANHAAVLQAAARGGVSRTWFSQGNPNTSASFGRNHTLVSAAPTWRVIHGRPELCTKAGPPQAVVLHAAYHGLWSLLRFSHRFPRNTTSRVMMAELGRKRFAYFGKNRTLPSSIVARFSRNIQTYARHVQQAFPEALVAIRTAQMLDYLPFTRSRKYQNDWEATPLLNVYIRQLNEALRKAARAQALAIFDVEKMLEHLESTPSSYLEEDNLHLNPEIGVQVLLEMLVSLAASVRCASKCHDRQIFR